VGLDTGEVEAGAAVLPATRGTGVLLELGLGLGLDAGDTLGDVGVEGEDNVGVPAEEGVVAVVPAEAGPGVGVGVNGEDEGRAVDKQHAFRCQAKGVTAQTVVGCTRQPIVQVASASIIHGVSSGQVSIYLGLRKLQLWRQQEKMEGWKQLQVKYQTRSLQLWWGKKVN